MLRRERLALRLRKTSGRIWVCQRCISQSQLRLSQRLEQNERSADSSKSKVVEDTSPVNLWRKAFALSKSQPKESQSEESQSPTDVFRREWTRRSPPETRPTVAGNFSLGQLAEEYRRSGTGRRYVKGGTWVVEPEQEEEDRSLDEIEEEISSAPELDDLSRLDEVELSTAVDVFAGENMRDYQGVIPLNGQDYEQVKYPLKLGTFVETRGY